LETKTKRGLSGFLLLIASCCCLPKEEVEGYIRTSELSRDPVDDPKKAIREEQEIEAMFMAVDRKKRISTLSIKAREHKEEETALRLMAQRVPLRRQPSSVIS
jgi:predicted RNA-binding protein with RPS1 domain